MHDKPDKPSLCGREKDDALPVCDGSCFIVGPGEFAVWCTRGCAHSHPPALPIAAHLKGIVHRVSSWLSGKVQKCRAPS